MDFLTCEDCRELSLALAWEGDAYAEVFPDSDLLWLESGFGENDLNERSRRSNVNTSQYVKKFARDLLEQLLNPCEPSVKEFFSTNFSPPPEPKSKEELIDRVWRKTWLDEKGDLESYVRDERWANEICKRSLGLQEGWIGVVVGWAHANPANGNQCLRGLLESNGFTIHPVRLGP